MSYRSQPPPRNYFGIAPGTEVRRSTAVVYHDALATDRLLTGALELEIEVLSPVHVGCGSFGLSVDRMVKEPQRRRGTLAIPGTSIKGACRQIFEALTASGSPFDRDEVHRPGRSERPPNASAAASLFGTLGLQGRVSFDDALPVGQGESAERASPTPERIALSVAYPPRKAVGRRFYGRMPEGADQPATIRAHAIPAGTVLVSTLRFRNAARSELGTLLTSLGVGLFTPRLGGGKYDDFGWVRFRPTAFRLRTRGFSGKAAWERRPEEVAAFLQSCRGEMRLDDAGRQALAILEQKLQFPGRDTSREGSP